MIGAANELLGLGLFAGGYPGPFGDDYAAFAGFAGAAAGASLLLSLLISRLE